MRILIVEDEKNLAATLKDLLESAGYEADTAFNGEDGLDMLLGGIYDAAVLDVMLPKMDGFSVLKQVRGSGNAVPVVMLTARSGLSDRIEGLDTGADYYLTKPFENEELLACLRTVLRRKGEIIPDQQTFGDLCLIPSASELACGERSVQVSARELSLLQLLFRNQGQYLSKEQILLKIWGYDAEVDANSVEAYVSFLRKKLALIGSGVKIAAARGIGYRLEE